VTEHRHKRETTSIEEGIVSGMREIPHYVQDWRISRDDYPPQALLVVDNYFCPVSKRVA